jgi:hypothetical protein
MRLRIQIPFAESPSWKSALLIPQLVLAVLAMMPTTASAVLIAEDLFLTDDTPTGAEYALGNLSGQNRSNLGFSGAWSFSTGTTASVIATSLNYPNTTEVGGSIQSPPSNSRVHRDLAAATNPFDFSDTGTVYLAFLLQTGSNSGYRAFEMHNDGTADTANRKFQIGYSTFGDFPSTSQYGFRVNDNPSLDFALGPVDDKVHLFLAKFELTTANNGDVITVWNNPDITGDLSSDPTGGVSATGFNFVADRLGVGHFSGSAYGFDELRIGTTLEDVLDVFLYCDFNDNGTCNSTDFQTLSDHMFLPGTFVDGDIDDSGIVDFADYRLFKDHPARVIGFDEEGAGAGASAIVPEPASLLLSGIAVLCICSLFLKRAKRLGPWVTAIVLVGTILCSSQVAEAAEQDLLNDTITFSGSNLKLQPYVTLPGGFSNIIGMTWRPGDTRMYVTTEQGTIFAINDDGNGNTTPVTWFNASSALQTGTGRSMNFGGGQQGLQSVAFHPDFDNESSPGYGKLYTTMLENRPANPNSPAHFYLGNSTYGGPFGPIGNPINADGVLAEWTYNFNTQQVDANSYREVFRTNMPNYDHPIKQARFNPYAEPEDEDYGLLYLTHGDSNNQDSLNDDPQDRGDVLGKMLRINPLESGGDRYTVPSSNPFYSGSSPTESGILGEVYAYGYRNPHTFSFNQDDEGNVHILVGDIGRSNMEEINTAVPGGNYGWTKREGTFVHEQTSINVDEQDKDDPPPNADAGYILGVADLPANEATVGVGPDGNRYIYPVAQYDHNGPDVYIGEDYTATSVASGYVIRNGSDPNLDDQFIFHNFAFNHGDVYHTDFDEMRNAVTQLDPGDEDRDEPGELAPAELRRLHLELDHDNNPNTAPVTGDNLNSVLGTFRNDGRYGEGLQGEMYISTKSNDIYLVANTLPALRVVVDRSTGEMTLLNVTRGDIEIDSIAIESPSGSLVPGQFQMLDGSWTLSPGNDPNDLSQDTAGSLLLTNVTTGDLGNAYDAKLYAFGVPAGEDLEVEYTLEGGGTVKGYVQYFGESAVPNTVVLTVDIASGKAAMLNQTPFAQEVEGYTIVSDGDQLNAAGWESLDSQGIDGGDWQASPPEGSHRLTELTENGTTTFDDSASFGLGQIFQTGQEGDLEFAFLLDGEDDARVGLVQYILAGDYNNDGKVSAADYTVWRDHLGSTEGLPNDLTPEVVDMDDYEMLLTNFGMVLPEFGSGSGSGSSLGSIPEPASLGLIGIACLALVAAHIRRFRCG